MSNEQNIYDILKQLKSSVSEDGYTEKNEADYQISDDISDEALQNRLKMQYFDADGAKTETDEKSDSYNDYSIDDDFFTDVAELEETAEVEPEVEEPVVVELETVAEPEIEEEIAIEDDVLEEEVFEQEAADIEDAVESLPSYDEAEFFSMPDELELYAEEQETDEDDVIVGNDEEIDDQDDGMIPLVLDEETEDPLTSEDFEIFEEPATFELYNADETVDEALVQASDDADASEAVVIDSPETAKALDFDVYAPALPEKDENVTAELYKLFYEEKANEPAPEVIDEPVEEPEEIPEQIEEPDFSEMNIMMQLGLEDELKRTVGDDKVEDFMRYDIADKEQQRVEKANKKVIAPRHEVEDYVSPEQNETIKDRYRTDTLKSIIKLLGVFVIFALIAMIEFMPILGSHAGGVLDYNAYPALYMLFGTQLLVLASVVVYKPIISGIACAAALKPTRHSGVAIVTLLTLAYDLIMIIVVAASGADMPPMFNAFSAMLLVLLALTDFVMILCEKKIFNVYSAGEKKYTLSLEDNNGRIKEKLVRGGVGEDRNVYVPDTVEFPNGLKQLLGSEGGNWRLMLIFAIPAFILGIIASIVSISLGRELSEIAATLMVFVCLSVPITMMLSELLPCVVATVRLEKRGSAVAGVQMYEKYGECDMVAFKDTHLFEKCKTEELGIAMYDTSVGYLALGCFKALYDKIGGPLSEISIDLPDVFKFDDVKIRRIAKNGIDAVIDSRHSLLVGDYAFMQRYGLAFPKSDTTTQARGVGVLCISLNQKVTAKISVKYKTVELFEMLCERLSSDGITPIISTYDPLISSAFVAQNRTIGDAPIVVVHKNSSDFYANKAPKKRYAPDGMISCMSSLKLTESLVWCKRVAKIRSLCETTVSIFSVAGMLFSVFAVALGMAQYFNQGIMMLYALIQMITVGVITFLNIPSTKYFTVQSLREDIEKMSLKNADATVADEAEIEDEPQKEKKKIFSISFKNRKKDQDEE